MAWGTARTLGAQGRLWAALALGEPDDPGGTVLGIQAVQDGEAVLDQPAHRPPPGSILRDAARFALNDEHVLGKGGPQPNSLVEKAPVADRRSEVVGAFAFNPSDGPRT